MFLYGGKSKGWKKSLAKKCAIKIMPTWQIRMQKLNEINKIALSRTYGVCSIGFYTFKDEK